MAVLIGSARSSYGNTTPGDQNGGREVSTENYYVHSKGWTVIRAKDAAVREKIALAMERACANDDIGYSQGTRNTLFDNVKPYGYDPARTTKKVNTDCSALVRVCVHYAGITVGDFITSTEVSKLMGTGAFEKFTDDAHCKSSDHLLRGDILDTRTKGHTVVVLSNGAKVSEEVVSIVYKLGERILKNGMTGEDVKEMQTYLIQLDYDCGIWGADGEFGDSTQRAVEQFQTAHGCAVDGEVGPETLAALMKALEAAEVPVAEARYVKIVNGNCYVRSAPNTDGKKLGVAHRGDILNYQGVQSADGWHLVEYNGQNGWVSGKYSELAEAIVLEHGVMED